MCIPQVRKNSSTQRLPSHLLPPLHLMSTESPSSRPRLLQDRFEPQGSHGPMVQGCPSRLEPHVPRSTWHHEIGLQGPSERRRAETADASWGCLVVWKKGIEKGEHLLHGVRGCLVRWLARFVDLIRVFGVDSMRRFHGNASGCLWTATVGPPHLHENVFMECSIV